MQTIEKIQDSKLIGLQLITDSQDVKAVFEYIGRPKLYDKYQGLFVEIKDGNYVSIYGFAGTVPYLHKEVRKIKH
jgi:hypothetical protein